MAGVPRNQLMLTRITAPPEGDLRLSSRRSRSVKLVGCADGLAFDHTVEDGTSILMSGGGGSGLCSHMRGVRGVGGVGEGRPGASRRPRELRL